MRRPRVFASGVALTLCLALATGCGGSSTGVPSRSQKAYDVIREMEPEVDQPSSRDDRAILIGTDSSRYPQRPQLRIVVYADWTQMNRVLVGTPSNAARPIGFCRRLAGDQARRICVVADRVTAEALPHAHKANLVASFASRYCWGWNKDASQELCVGQVPPR